MGFAIECERFTDEEFARFRGRLRENLEALRVLLQRPGFGVGPESIGAEMESSIVDDSACVFPINTSVVEHCQDPRVTLELVAFNVEFNLTPVPAAGRPFAALESELEFAISLLERACVREGGHLAPIGIVPTLRTPDLVDSRITQVPRYRALINGVSRFQASPVRLDIHGPNEALQVQSDTLAIEGSNTSFQVHLRIDPDRYAATYNAAQLATPLALALGANSPIFLERLLWDETRVPLFKQAFVGRRLPPGEWRPAVRVPFGHGWVRKGMHELLAEAVALFPPVLAACGDEDPVQVVRDGGVPELGELRLHQGTIWQWNRAVYDPSAGGHVRVEFRALPAGPTPVDMAATAAFMLGLTIDLREDIDALLPAFPFRYAEHNFYRAAQRGLDARLLWPSAGPPSPVERPVVPLIQELLPRAESGLARLGVEADERQRYLGVIQARLDSMTTGARWLRRSLLRLDQGRSRHDALERLTHDYLDRVKSRRPVHEWAEVA